MDKTQTTTTTEPLAPDASQVAGECPGCGGLAVRVPRHVGGVGGVVRVECWDGLADGLGCPGKREG